MSQSGGVQPVKPMLGKLPWSLDTRELGIMPPALRGFFGSPFSQLKISSFSGRRGGMRTELSMAGRSLVVSIGDPGFTVNVRLALISVCAIATVARATTPRVQAMGKSLFTFDYS